MPPPSSSGPARPGPTRFERLSRAYADEVYPLFDRWFSEPLVQLLTQTPLRAGQRVLDVGAGAGHLAPALAPATAVAAEPSGSMLALLLEGTSAQAYASVVRADGETGLPFASNSFDAVLCRSRADGGVDPWALLPEMVRVSRPGAVINLCGALRSTWSEPLDLLDEALERRGDGAARAALRHHRQRAPSPSDVSPQLAAAGVTDARVTVREKQVLFRSGREFFFSSLIDLGPLRVWKSLVGKGEPLQAAFAAVKDAIDTYYAGRPFAVTVAVATVTARASKT